jgi:hypothetical protein
MLNAAEMASMTTTVASSLDVTITRLRTTATAKDGYGHSTSPTQSSATIKCNVIKPSSTQLQAFADIIGSQIALLIRVMPTDDVHEGDTVVYMAKNWLVQNIQNAESYTFANEYLITSVQ